MKTDTQDRPGLAPHREQAILDEIRNDQDLIRRLKITPQEIEALSKCALLGTLTCKQDMLFILRQIREATSAAVDHNTLFPQPPPHAVREEAPGPDLRHLSSRVTQTNLSEPASAEGVVRRRLPEQFGIFFWVMVLVAGLVWNAFIIVSRWHDNFLTTVAPPVSQTADSGPWFLQIDSYNALLFWEAFFVGAIAIVMYLRSRRRYKFRTGRRLR